jgi:membrane fusion protein (multidrug efflux system)
MKFRQISIVAGGVLLVLGFLGKNILSNRAKMPTKTDEGIQKRMVAVKEIVVGEIPIEIGITGKLIAKEKIELFSEVNGRFMQGQRDFREGVAYSKGEVLVQIDDDEIRFNLKSAKSAFQNLLVQVLPDLKLDYPEAFDKWERYTLNLGINKTLPELPEVNDNKERLFLTARNIFREFYNIQALENRLSKYTIRAPFDGILSMVYINKGTLVRPNQKLGEFIAPNVFELESAVSKTEAALIKIGDSVALKTQGGDLSIFGRVSRKNANLNPQTQSLSIYVEVKGSQLYEGMFLSGAINAGNAENAAVVDRKLLNDNQQIFIVVDSIMKLVTVQVVHASDGNAVIKGLNNGDLILENRLNGIYDGMVVKPYKY